MINFNSSFFSFKNKKLVATLAIIFLCSSICLIGNFDKVSASQTYNTSCSLVYNTVTLSDRAGDGIGQLILGDGNYIKQVLFLLNKTSDASSTEYLYCLLMDNLGVNNNLTYIEMASNNITVNSLTTGIVQYTFLFNGSTQLVNGHVYHIAVLMSGVQGYIMTGYWASMGLGGQTSNINNCQTTKIDYTHTWDTTGLTTYRNSMFIIEETVSNSLTPQVNFYTNGGGSISFSPLVAGDIWGGNIGLWFSVNYAIFDLNDKIKVNAISADGYHFVNFTYSDGITGTDFINPVILTVNQSLSITANFALGNIDYNNTHVGSFSNLVFVNDLGGTATFLYSGSFGSGSYGVGNYILPINSSLTFSTMPNSDYVFSNWKITSNNGIPYNLNSNPLSVILNSNFIIECQYTFVGVTPTPIGNSGIGGVIAILTSIFGNIATDMVFIIFGVICSLTTWKFGFTGLIAGIGISTLICTLAGILPIWGIGLCIVLDVALIILGSGLLNKKPDIQG